MRFGQRNDGASGARGGASRRAFLTTLSALLVPGGLAACGSQQDVVGRVNAGAGPDDAAVPTDAPTFSSPPGQVTDSDPFDAGAQPPWFDRDAGHGLEVIVRARLAPPDAPGADRWPLPRPLAPFEPEPQPAPDFSGGMAPTPFFDPDAGFESNDGFDGTGGFDGTAGLEGAGGVDGAGGHDEHDDPMWDGEGTEPHPSSSSDVEDRPEPPLEILLRFFGRDAERLIEWSTMRLSAQRDSEPRLIEDSSGTRYFVVLRLGL